MLESHRLIQTSDANEIEAAWIEHSRGSGVDMSGAGTPGEFVANDARFDDGVVTYCRYGSPIAVRFAAADYTRLIYQMRDGSAITLEGEASDIESSAAGCLIPAGRLWHARHADELEDLAVRIPTATLQRKLSAYLGSDCQALDLLQPAAADPAGAMELRQRIVHFAIALDSAKPQFLPNLVTSFLDDISLRMLICFRQEVLAEERTPSAPSAIQLGRTEQYLLAHFAEPLTLETLADVSGVGARSVIRYFQMKHGFTPWQYLERARVQIAHVQLRILSGHTVESVALHCGFPSVAALERSYQQQFGMPPTPRPA
jgi:AraC-like DNA-binding protein